MFRTTKFCVPKKRTIIMGKNVCFARKYMSSDSIDETLFCGRIIDRIENFCKRSKNACCRRRLHKQRLVGPQMAKIEVL